MSNRHNTPQLINKDLKNTNLEVQCSLVCKISLVPSQSYYNIWTGLSLKLFNPVLRPHKWLLANKTGRGECVTQLVKITIRSMWWKDEDSRSLPVMSGKAFANLFIKVLNRDSLKRCFPWDETNKKCPKLRGIKAAVHAVCYTVMQKLYIARNI